MHAGPSAIVAALNRLPRTTHPLHDASKFVVDAWLVPNVDVQARTDAGTCPDALLFISVHGEYAEAPSQGVRSFDRTFLVAPAVPGSEAATHGWPCTIVSDQLTVRHYSLPDAWRSDSLPTGDVPPDAGAAAPVPQQTPVAGLPTGLPTGLQSQEPPAGMVRRSRAQR